MQYLNYRLLGFKLYESVPPKESVCVLLDKVFQVFYFMFLPLWYVVNAFPPYFVTSSLCEKPICKYLREMVEMGCSSLFGSSHLYDSSNNLEHFWSLLHIRQSEIPNRSSEHHCLGERYNSSSSAYHELSPAFVIVGQE